MEGRYNSQIIDETIAKLGEGDFAYLVIVQELTRIGIGQHEAEEVADTAQGMSNEDAEDYIRTFLEAV